MELQQQFAQIVRSTPWLMRALQAVRELAPPQWCIGAGAVRNAVWDALHGYTKTSALADVDVAYFDGADLGRESETQYQHALGRLEPDLRWDVVNQAGVHLWFPRVFGYAVPPLSSIEEAVGSWPETATSVGVWLDQEDRLEVIAPVGLRDLFAVVVRRNARRVSVETFRRRLEEKQYAQRWPRVRVIAE